MFRFRRFVAIAVALVGVALLGMPTQAHADFELRVSTDGGSSYTYYNSTDGGKTWYTGTSGGTLVGSSVNADNFSIGARSTDSLGKAKSTMDLTVSGTDTSQTYSLIVQASVTDVPTGPPPQALSWKFTSSSDLAGMTETAQGWVDAGNKAFSNGSILANTGTLTAPSSGITAFSDANPYSWTEQYMLTGTANDGGGDQISGDNNEKITAPAPSGLLLGFVGMPTLGLGALIRRRRTKAMV